jgi:hypothetical protein
MPSNVNLPDDLLHAIGHVTALWAQLEFIIDWTIRQALDRPPTSDIDTALIVPFRKRAALLASLAKPHLTDQRLDFIEFTKTVVRLQHERDLIVHGAMGGSSRPDKDGTTVFTFRRIRWDRPIRLLERRAMSVADVEEVANKISDAVAIAGHFEIILDMKARPSRGKR